MIYVLGHNYAYTDVDSIVSSIVLADMLNQKGCPAEPVIVNPKAIGPTSVKIINRVGGLKLPKLKAHEEVINKEIALVDHNNPLESYAAFLFDTTPEEVSFTVKTPLICIDHHTDAGYPISFKMIERVGATCTILAEIIMVDNNIKLSDLYARALVYGIVCDTKGLKSRKTSFRDWGAIQYLYRNYKIGVELREVAEHVVSFTDASKMSSSQILKNSLKEYGDIGIATIEVLNDDYTAKLEEIREKAFQAKYSLYILMVFKQHVNETLVYYFDKKYGNFPNIEKFDGLISRSQDLVPYVFKRIEGKTNA